MPHLGHDNVLGGHNNGGDGSPRRSSEEPEVPGEGATSEQLRELEKNNNKRKIAELTKERDDYAAAQSGRQRRRRAPPQEPTPIDFKYKAAGQRCALLGMLWITPDLHEIKIDWTYSDELRYSDNNLGMRTQGERKDMLFSMAEDLVRGLDEEEHFRKVFGDGVSTQRRTSSARVRSTGSLCFGVTQDMMKNEAFRAAHEDFHDLLGYTADEDTPSKKWPTMAPVLYLDGRVDQDEFVFRSSYIKAVFRAIMFGPSSVEGQANRRPGPKIIADVLGIKSVTPGAIAAAATWTRWAISPDEEFRKIGRQTGINWRIAYQDYKEIIIRGLRREKEVMDGNPTVAAGPYTKLVSEWNSEFFPEQRDDRNLGRDSDGVRLDVLDVIARAEAFGQ
ncbi:hypothetical protein FRC07_012435, partial [Ceratobasidium sp. 392]